MMTTAPVRTTDRLSPSEAAGVLAIAAAARQVDGVYPLSEGAVLRVRHAEPGVASGAAARVHLLSVFDGEPVGYAYLDRSDPDGPSGELVVHPRHRLRGHGSALLAAAAQAPGTQAPGTQAPGTQAPGTQAPGTQAAGTQAAGNGGQRFWAHGDEPGARAFAERNGFHRARVLWQMRRSLAADLPAAPLPAGVTLRHFRPGADDEAWLGINSRAFAHHPEQGRWTESDLRLRIDEPWFDANGFLLAVDIEDTLLGYHWTKVHSADPDDPAIGEIYVLGVEPGGHRRGLGVALSVASLDYLKRLGLAEAMLYVDESNAAAVALYDRLGFEIWSTDVMYAR